MARAFAQAGAKVAALDLNEDAVKGLAKECVTEGFICEEYQVNVLEAESLEEVHRQILKDLGPCDILINGAGGNEDGKPTARSRKILDGTPMGRFVEGEEFLGGIFFLCSEKAASAITGVVLPIDAGFAAYSGV